VAAPPAAIHTRLVARLLALSVLAVAVSSAAGPTARPRGREAPYAPAAARAADLDGARLVGDQGDAPTASAPPLAAAPARPDAAACDGPTAGATAAPAALPLLALAPKTSPPLAPRRP
jgi:hypothetical protein